MFSTAAISVQYVRCANKRLGVFLNDPQVITHIVITESVCFHSDVILGPIPISLTGFMGVVPACGGANTSSGLANKPVISLTAGHDVQHPSRETVQL